MPSFVDGHGEFPMKRRPAAARYYEAEVMEHSPFKQQFSPK
jgi:hypothetical protein